MSAPRDPFEGLPSYDERLCASFEPLATPPDALARAQLEAEASGLLHTLLALEEYNAPRSEEECENAAEFQRLDRKLDLILELLSARLRDDQPSPERAVSVCAAGLRWQQSATPPAPGTIGMARVFLHRMLPRALCLPAEVIADQTGWLRLRYLTVGEECEERLLRHVFLQHRRRLAGTRRQRADAG